MRKVYAIDSNIRTLAKVAWMYRSGMVNSNTVNSKFHVIGSLFENFGKNPIISCLK